MARSSRSTVTSSLRALALAAIFAGTSIPTGALAWGSEGHQYVGNLGWLLLNPNARKHVRSLLGRKVSLGQAAVWPDCVRSVSGSPSTGFSYHGDQYTPQVCKVFGKNPTEVNRMTNYASRNWTNCPYEGAPAKCNLSYHFADVNVHEHGDYSATYFGAQSYDVVHAINAAVAILRCKPGQSCAAPAPFSITSKREALLLLAHFVGDVHQPLHVGAIYLDGSNAQTDDSGAPTAGGNFLLLPPTDKENLHHSWDQIPSALSVTPDAAAISSACQILAASNPSTDVPETWASESVAAARAAYSGMTFTRDANAPKDWDIQFQDQQGYAANRASAQTQRLVSAGVRLAEVLNSIWPSTRKPAACR
jgi:S1/P1 nuclease